MKAMNWMPKVRRFARDNDGNTLLMAAARANPSAEVLKLLLAAGAEIDTYNNQGQTPLMLAAGYYLICKAI